ncbi:MAG: histidine kinase [Bacteroidota bacterium]
MPRIYLLFLIWIPSLIIGQHKFDHPIVINTADGLPSAGISTIAQDRQGFIWIASWKGLVRYDGSHMKVFDHDPRDSTSIYNNTITDLLIEEDRIWITTYQGFSILDLNQETFNNYQETDSGSLVSPTDIAQERFDIYRDRQGVYWISGQGGFGRIHLENEQVERLPYTFDPQTYIPEKAFRVNHVREYLQDQNNDSLIWAKSQYGLLQLNKYSGKIRWFFIPHTNKTEEYYLNQMSAGFVQDINGTLYMGTWHRGVIAFDPTKEEFDILTPKGTQLESLLNGSSLNLTFGSDKKLWFTNINGLFEYDIEEEEFRLFKKNNNQTDSLFGITYIDEQQRVWLESERGVYLFDPLLQQFDLHSYQHLTTRDHKTIPREVLEFPDRQELLILSQFSDGLYHFDRSSETWSKTAAPDGVLETKASFNIWDAASLPSGEWLLLEAGAGLFTYTVGTGVLKAFPHQAHIHPRSFRELLLHSQGDLWISNTRGGLIRYDLDANTYASLPTILDYPDPFVSGARVKDMLEDSQGHIWISRPEGYSVYFPETDSFLHRLESVHPELVHRDVKNFVEDSYGHMWMGSYDSFLAYAQVDHPEEGIIGKISIAKGDEAYVPIFLEKDHNGNIWAISNEGLVQVDPQSKKVFHIRQEYGINGDQLWLMKRLSTGEMVLGHRDAISIFHPDSLQLNTERPRPYLSEFKVFAKPLFADTSLLTIKDIYLDYSQNFFSFEFSAISYTLAEKNTFEYKLEGFEDEWVAAGNRRFANYTNVPGGSYTFHVRAFNNEGLAGEKEFSIDVFISTPWWASWWFKTGLALFFCISALLLIRARIRKIRYEERIKAAFERKLTSAELYALRSQMNPHFIFNSLNSIDYYIIKNETAKASDYLNQFSRLIRLILQNSRSEYINLTNELEALKLYMDMERLRFKNRFEYEFLLDPQLSIDMVEIPPMLLQPYVENAIWHGLMHKQGSGKIRVSIHQLDTQLRCVIEDDGIGREKAQTLKSSYTRKKKASIGMKLTKDRIDMIQRLYQVDASVDIIDLKDPITNIGSGTKVIITIPLHRKDL